MKKIVISLYIALSCIGSLQSTTPQAAAPYTHKPIDTTEESASRSTFAINGDILHQASKPEYYEGKNYKKLTPESQTELKAFKDLLEEGKKANIPNWPDISSTPSSTKTPLYYAVTNSNYNKTKMLLDYGADPVKLREDNGSTAKLIGYSSKASDRIKALYKLLTDKQREILKKRSATPLTDTVLPLATSSNEPEPESKEELKEIREETD
jgi:hypothetical protein